MESDRGIPNVTRLPVRNKRDTSRGLRVVDPFQGKCTHSPEGNTYSVDVAAGTVRCGKCQELLSPAWVLLQLANCESRWLHNRDAHEATMRKLAARQRTRCAHCGKMTPVRVS